MSDPLIIFLILFCILLEGLFSGAEIALVASDINKIRGRAEGGSRSAALVLKLLRKPEWFFATTLTGTDLCIIVSSVLSTSLFIAKFGPIQGEFISAAIMVPIILIFGEIIPKSLFQQQAESIALRLAWFVVAASWLLYPVVYVISLISRGTIRVLMPQRVEADQSHITTEGLKFLLKRGTVTDVKRSEKEMVSRVLDFAGQTAGDVMVPLSNVLMLEKNMALKEATAVLKGKWYSRVPVYDGKIFNMVGILHGFDLLKAQPEAQNEAVGKYMRTPVFFVPETKQASDLLIEMQKKGEQMAVVVDEYGGAVGILTIEDILEEIVGEIEDEYDRSREYRKIGTGRYVFNARTGVASIREMLHLDIPEGEYESLAGFILDKMGKIPNKGERLTQPDAVYVIQDADSRSIKEILIILPNETDNK